MTTGCGCDPELLVGSPAACAAAGSAGGSPIAAALRAELSRAAAKNALWLASAAAAGPAGGPIAAASAAALARWAATNACIGVSSESSAAAPSELTGRPLGPRAATLSTLSTSARAAASAALSLACFAASAI